MHNKENTVFQIKFQAPLTLAKSPSFLKFPKIVKWRVVGLEIKEEDNKEKIFVLSLKINTDDINEKTQNDDLLRFRDMIIGLLSVVTLCPIRLVSKGLFTFHLGLDKWQQKSLGAMNVNYSFASLNRYDSIINGLALSDDYMIAFYFLEKAIGAEQLLYEFINLAICCELIVNKDSLEVKSINPKCKEGHILTNCPTCDCKWLIPNPLRNRARFFMDELLSKKFAEARAKVFHGSSSQIDNAFLLELRELNMRIMVVLRNYLGKKIGLPPITESELPASIKLKDTKILPSVFYTLPSNDNSRRN
jgi:hypothetical protein